MGVNPGTSFSSPIQIGALTNWARVDVGGGHTGAVKTDGTLWTWGDNDDGQLGQNISRLTDRSSPVQVGSGTNWYKVSAGTSHTLATKTDGTLWGWGNNGNGQLGQNNTIRRSSPVQVGAETYWQNPAAGDNYTGVTTKDNP